MKDLQIRVVPSFESTSLDFSGPVSLSQNLPNEMQNESGLQLGSTVCGGLDKTLYCCTRLEANCFGAIYNSNLFIETNFLLLKYVKTITQLFTC